MTPIAVLNSLISDCETLARSGYASERTRTLLLRISNDVRKHTEEDELNTNDICNCIEDLYWGLDGIRSKQPELFTAHPAISRLMDDYIKFVEDLTGCIHHPSGGVTATAKSFDEGLLNINRRKRP